MKRILCSASLLAVGLSCPALSAAQTATPTPEPVAQNVLVSEGIGGDIDKHHRGPLLSIGIKREPAVVKILVDASIQNEQYLEYPVQLDYYINRMHFTSQIRSKALPGPLGIDVGNEYAAPPFNYTVVGKVLHPNREFTTVIEGAVYELDLAASLDCTLTRPVEDDENASKVYTESSVVTVQLGNDTFLLNASALKTPNKGSSASVNGNVTVKNSDGTASASLTIIEGTSSASVDVTGTFTSESGKLNSISLTSEDGETEIECS